MMSKFTIGDFVMALDDDIEGKVIKVDQGMCTILSDDGFEVAYHEKELVMDKSTKERLDFTNNFSTLASQNTEFKKRPKQVVIKKKEKLAPAMEVDLHIHKLVKNQKGMTNYDMLTIQLDTAKRQLEFAISKRIPRVVFIHGVGQGVLRAELEYMFRRYEGIRYEDGDYKKYGVGALAIYILQNQH